VNLEVAAESRRIGFPALWEGPDGMRFGLCPAGPFPMGSGEGNEPHEARFALPCYIGLSLVTNAAVRAWRPAHGAGEPDDPATGLDRGEAAEYAAWLSERESPDRYRLPTEAEWERGTGLFGLPPKNGPSEWTSDRFAPLPLWGVTNYEGPAEGDTYAVRGGALGAQGRTAVPGDRRASDLGFRLVRILGYGDAEHGAFAVTFRTVDPTAEGGPAERPGYSLRLIAVADRLTDRQMGRALRWSDLPRLSPHASRIVPGRYYAYAWRQEGDTEVRGREHKFDAIDGDLVVDVPIPEEDQVRGPPPNPSSRVDGRPREYR
jgi:hypothetical protein